MNEREKVALVTGYPTSFLAVRVVHKILTEESWDLRLVVQEKFLERAEKALAEFDSARRDRVRLLVGDAAAMDLGLSGAEFVALAREVDLIHHCAAVTYLGADKEVARRLNVDGTREVLELAQEAEHLERLVHWSTALVSGGRRGYVLEEELDPPADGWRNVVEETRFLAEALVRRQIRQVPTTILRPAIIVGDSATGEIDRLEGPYLLVLLMLNAPVDFRIPLPGRGEIPLNLVPVDYVVDAGFAIAKDRRSLGRTFHLVDPTPHSARRVFELIARTSGRPLPRGSLPTKAAAALLRTPGLERFAHVPRAFLEQLATEVVYDDRNAREILGETEIGCPPFESYVDVMVDYVRDHQATRQKSA